MFLDHFYCTVLEAWVKLLLENFFIPVIVLLLHLAGGIWDFDVSPLSMYFSYWIILFWSLLRQL